MKKVYNLTVNNFHTYYVGVSGVLGHNAKRCPITDDTPAENILNATLKRNFPSEYLTCSINKLNDLHSQATGEKKAKLHKALKLLTQGKRLMDKLKGK